MVLASFLGSAQSVAAQGQETCPQGGGWDKEDDVNALSFSYDAPSGDLIAERCYKVATTLVWGVVNPPSSSVEVETSVLNPVGNNTQDISHASFRLVSGPGDPIGPEDPIEPEDPGEPKPTAPPPMASVPSQPVVQSTPAPVVAPTTGASSGPATLVISAASALGLSGLSLGAFVKRRKQ